MKAPEFKPFVKEEFADAPWIEKLLRPLNTVLGQTVSGLRNGLTLGENLNAEVKTIDVTTSDPWIAPTLTNSWVDSGGSNETAAYRKDGSRVYVRGTIKDGALAAAAFTFPTGYRPANTVYFPAVTSGGAIGWISVTSAGVLTPNAGSNLSYALDTVNFEPSDPTPDPNPAFPVRFATKVKSVAGVVVLRAVKLSGRDLLPLYAPVHVDWDQDANNVTIKGITGLVGGATYRLKLAVIGG